MAVICTFLASSGFVAAGYADTSSADAAAALSPQNFSRISSSYDAAAAISFAPVAVGGVGEKISFDKMFLQARKPAAQQILDLTDPNGNTPHLARGFTAMRGNIPEVSVDEISQVRAEILTAAYQGLGHPYVWGGTSFYNGWDCSGFVQWAYAQAGVALPRTEQWAPMIETNSPQPGDIVVQNPDGPNHWSHIGIYIGNGKMISALNPSVGTIMHAPSDTSSSSTYFTIPAFASADEQAKADAAAKKADKGKSSASATATPTKSVAATPTPTKSVTPTAPATPAPTKPTEPGTTKPATPKPPVTTPPTTLPPTTVPTTPPTPKPTVATQPATTAPATTAPDPTTPATTTEAAKTSAPSETPTPSSAPPASSSPILRPSDVGTAAESQAADPTAAQTAAARSTGTEPPTAPSP
ncbi:C40 family peptidase [Arthrobacter sp. PAMC 25486]|uniref:C40 family peptidase n=1 Tax=Arthrobacter sp. PAMC 25486 TaxID=1494608 RepID=UPI0009DF8792|nr:C40 family peptidase [Arthrobacter sp. PAMC 25486]